MVSVDVKLKVCMVSEDIKLIVLMVSGCKANTTVTVLIVCVNVKQH